MKNFILNLFQGYTDLRPTNTTLADLGTARTRLLARLLYPVVKGDANSH